MEYVSNSQFSDSEFSKWKIEVNNAGNYCTHSLIVFVYASVYW